MRLIKQVSLLLSLRSLGLGTRQRIYLRSRDVNVSALMQLL
jgi:hypothetical protein